MSIAPLSSPSLFTPATSATAASTSQAAAFDPQADISDDPAAAANNLTGSSTGSLDSQTLQALMDLTQGSGAQGSWASSQAQGAHPHHHHHHGGQQASGSAPATDAAAGDTATAPAPAAA